MLLRVMIDDGERHFLNKRDFLHFTIYTTVVNISLSITWHQVWLLQHPPVLLS